MTLSREVIVAIDQGTTNTKGLLVSSSGAPVFCTAAPVSLIHAHPGHIEQSPEAIWASVVDVASKCVGKAAESGFTVAGISISNQRETAVAWHRTTGEPLGNAVSWQCPRSAGICRALAAHSHAIQSRTGLPLNPLVTASKWRWMLAEDRASPYAELADAGELCLGTVDSWLIYKMTEGAVHATDHSNASRTALLNLRSLAWDDALLALFDIPASALPQILPSSSSFGRCSGIPGLAGVDIVAAVGDSHAAMAVRGCDRAGTIKATYGTGSSVMMLSGGFPEETSSLARTVAWSTSDGALYALEGNISMTGSAVQWVGEFLGLAHPSEDAVALAAEVEDAAGLFFVPAMAGLGAPYWDPEARGSMFGLGRSHKAAHLARAAVDAIAYQVADVFYAMEEASQSTLPALHADGGATRNRDLMQFQADIVGRSVLRSTIEELSCLGAAWLGGLTLGWWKTLAQPHENTAPPETFNPMMDETRRTRLYPAWKSAVQQTLGARI
jgi:glycerol kinase